MAVELTQKTFDELSFGPEGRINCSGTLEEGGTTFDFTVVDGFCLIQSTPTSSDPATDTQKTLIYTALEAQFGAANVRLTSAGEIIHLHPKKSWTERAREGASRGAAAVSETAKRTASAVGRTVRGAYHEATRPSYDAALKAALDPDGDGLVNYNEEELGKGEIHIEDGIVFLVPTGGLREKVTEPDKLQVVADELTTKYCRGKDFKVELKDGLIVLVPAKKDRAEAPEFESVRKGVTAVRNRLKKTFEKKEDKTAKKAADAARIAELKADAEVQAISNDVRTEHPSSANPDETISKIATIKGKTPDEIKPLVVKALEYLMLTGEIDTDEGKTNRKKRNNLRKAQETAEEYGLVRFVQNLRTKGISDRGIRVKLRKTFMKSDDWEAAYDFAFRVAGERKRSGLFNRAKSRIPFVEERAWDKILIEEGLVRKIRKMRDVDGKEDPEIEKELKDHPGDHARLDELVDYAFSQADSKGFREKSALHFAREHSLIHEVRDKQEEKGFKEAKTPEAKDAITTSIKTEIKETILAAIETDADGKKMIADAEVEEIIKASFEGTASGLETGKVMAIDKPMEGAKKTWKWIKEHKEQFGTAGKVLAFGAAGVTVVGGLALAATTFAAFKVLGWGWSGLKWAGRGVQKAAPFVGTAAAKTWPYLREGGKQVFIEKGPRVLGQVLKTALWNVPVRAPARIISRPFVRLWQTARAAVNVVPKANKKVGRGFFGRTAAFLRNGTLGGLHRLGQAATLAAALALSPLTLTAGVLEGATNAVAKDVIGLEHGISEPIDKFLKISGSSGTSKPAAPAAAATPAAHGTHP